MLSKIKRLFIIKTRWEAYLIIYALALGAMTRGAHYTEIYPGWPGYVLMAATAGAVFLGGAKILDALRYEAEAREVAVRSDGDAALAPAPAGATSASPLHHAANDANSEGEHASDVATAPTPPITAPKTAFPGL
tara:strand:- start:193 stop:594 length:402 start_codon:yes stop_codon:yes gene_type:complete